MDEAQSQQPNNEELRRLICDVVESAVAPLREQIGELRAQITETAQRQDTTRDEADQKIQLIRTQVHDNAAAVLMTREHISTLQTESAATNRAITATLQTNSALLQKIDDRMSNVNERQDHLTERLTWMASESDETRTIAARADAEAVRLTQDLSDSHQRFIQLVNLVEANKTGVNRLTVDMDDLMMQHRPLIEFAEIKKAQAEAREATRRKLAEAAKTRPVLTAIVALAGIFTGTGAVEIIDTILSLF